MRKIGLLIAVETDAFIRKFGEPVRTEKIGAMTLRIYEKENLTVFALHTGQGEILAAAGAQYLISVCQAEFLMNFGIVGGLTPDMKRSLAAVITKIVHYDNDTSAVDPVLPCQYPEYPDIFIPVDQQAVEIARKAAPALRPVICASSDRFVADPAKKRELYEKYGAEICEMEAAGIARVAFANQVPALFIKVVADAIGEGGDAYWKAKETTGELAVSVLEKIIEEIR